MADRVGAQGWNSTPQMQTFNLINPYDRTEDVRLMVQPLAVPADWKLSVRNAEQGSGDAAATQTEFPIHEVTPGREYVVSLSAKRQIKVASVLVPVGEVGPNTTARWTVEGRIGNEVVGTMVHEMNTPYLVADLKLPPWAAKSRWRKALR